MFRHLAKNPDKRADFILSWDFFQKNPDDQQDFLSSTNPATMEPKGSDLQNI